MFNFTKLVSVRPLEGDLVFWNKRTNKPMFVIFSPHDWDYVEGSTFEVEKWMNHCGLEPYDFDGENTVYEDDNISVHFLEA